MRNEKKDFSSTDKLDTAIERMESYKMSHEELLEFMRFLIDKLKEHKVL